MLRLTSLLCLVLFVAGLNAQTPQKVEPLVPQKVVPFPLESVRLTDGSFLNAQKREEQYLLSVDPDRLLSWFRKNAGLTPKAEAYGGWEQMSVAGHSLGHYLSACSLLYASTGNPKLKEKADYVVKELAECQEAGKIGLVCAIPDGFRIFDEVANGEIRSKGFDLNGGWVPWYVLHKEFAGLIDAYGYCGNAQALEVARRLGDWAVRTTQNLDDEKFQRMLDCEFGGMNEVLAELYALTGEESYLTLSQRFYHRRVMDPFARGIDALPGLHANTQIPKFVGLARVYEMTGNSEAEKGAAFFWDRMANFHSYVTGGNSINEHLGEPGKLNDRLGQNTTETCNTYNMLKLTRHLYGWTGDPKYFDFYERGLFNHILGSQNPTDGMVTYFVPLESGLPKTYSTPFDTFTCCHGTGMENHSKYGDSIYWHGKNDDGDVLYVNAAIPSELNWKERGITVRLDTEFPNSEHFALTIRCKEPTKGTLCLRKPRRTACKMLDCPADLNVKDDAAFITVSGVFPAESTLRWEAVGDLYLETMPDNSNRVALFYGPVLLAADLGPTDKPLDAAQIPVLVTENREPSHWLKRLPGKELAFETVGVGKPSELRFTPFYAMHHRRYGVYFDLYDTAVWKEREAELRRLTEERERLERLTVDRVVIGEAQSERDHNLQGENTRSGKALGMDWRDAPNGWFSFDLKVRPERPQQLVLTYWGSDAGRVFDVSINGQKVVTQKLDNNAPNKLFDIVHPLPKELLQGKTAITVRLEAHPGNTAGGLFGCRVVETSAFGAISGTVIDDNGNPVAGADVELILDETTLNTVSTADGTYRFPMTQELLASMSATIRATVEGAKMIGIDDGTIWDRREQSLIDLVGTPLDIELRPAHRTEIIVRNEKGEPVEDAKVEALIDFERGHQAPFSGPPTDASGRSFVEIPDNVAIRDVWAMKDGVGLDYLHNTIPPEQAGLDLRQQRYRIADRLPEKIELTLGGAEKITVFVHDADGKPVENAKVTPWIITLPGQTDGLNLSNSRMADTLSDNEGNAVLDWIPVNRLGDDVEFDCSKNRARVSHRPQLMRGVPWQPVELATRRMSVSGTVFDETGEPLPGVLVDTLFLNRTLTDKEGKYRLQFEIEFPTSTPTDSPTVQIRFRPPLELSERNLIPGVVKLAVPQPNDDGVSVAELSHVMQPGTVVRARVIVNGGRTSYAEMLEITKNQGRSLSSGPFISVSSDPPRSDFIPYSWFNRIARDGTVSFVLPPGKYRLSTQITQTRSVDLDEGTMWRSTRTVEIPQSLEDREKYRQSGAFDIQFPCTTIETVDLKFQVFRVDPATGEKTPERNATVYVARDYDIGLHEWKKVITDENGVTIIRRAVPAEGKAESEPLVYMAHSADGSFSGFGVWKEAAKDESPEPRVVELQPAVTMKGRFVDPNGEPIADGSITIRPRYASQEQEEAVFILCNAITAGRYCGLLHHVSGKDGRFEVKGLFPNRTYDIGFQKSVAECDATKCTTRVVSEGAKAVDVTVSNVYDVGDIVCLPPKP